MTALNIGKNLSQKDKANLLRHSKIKQSQPDKSQSLPQTQQSQVINNNGSTAANSIQLEKQSTSLSLTSSLNSQTQSNNQQNITTGRKSKAK